MPSNLNVVILAAGAGTRMRSSLPKVLHRLAGKPLLNHVLDTVKYLSPEKIAVVYGHGGEAVKQSIGGGDLEWIKQEPQLGTGHALMQARPCLDNQGHTLVLYGDVPLVSIKTLKRLIAAAGEKQYAVLTAHLDNADGYGRIIRNKTNRNIQAIVEHKDANSEQLKIKEINTGIMLIPNEYLHQWLSRLTNQNVQQEYYLTDLIGMAVDEGVVVTSSAPINAWEILGVNSRRQLADLERIYQRQYANHLLDSGVTLNDPNRIDVRGKLECGADVEIDINCIFEGKVVLGDRVKVKGSCLLRDVIIHDESIINPFSHIENAVIGKQCNIGPFARIRPATTVADHVQIGNFVEVKKSKIASGSKINHLSYIGDTDMGTNVNIGAGTITCNYDGANKHQTIIEDNVFIGSDTQLIAPVKIAYGSTIGAGSTITKDTPENGLTFSRSKQISKRGWKRPSKA